jgi:hypothetical protein
MIKRNRKFLLGQDAPDVIRRASLLGAPAALLSLRHEAQADTAFADFAFPATGTATYRTMPDRLLDVLNVKDWGALGNGRHNDAPNINAAIQYAITKGGGRIFFPNGNYNLGSAIYGGHPSLTASVQLIGAGRLASTFTGVNTIVGAKPGENDCLERIENLKVGIITLSGQMQILFGLMVFKIDCSGATAALLQGIEQNGGSRNTPDNANPGIDPASGIAVALGNQCVAQNVRIGGITDIGFSLAGYSCAVIACAAENQNTAHRLGWAPIHTGVTASLVSSGSTVIPLIYLPPLMIPGRGLSDPGGRIPGGTVIVSSDPAAKTVTISNPTSGGSIAASTTITFANECPCIGASVYGSENERCNCNVDLYNVNSCYIGSSLAVQGSGPGADPGGPISNLTWDGVNTVTATTPTPHNLFNARYDIDLGGGNHLLQILNTVGNNSWFNTTAFTNNNNLVVQGVDSTHFKWTGVTVNPGSKTADGSGNYAYWNYPPNVGMRVRKASQCFIQSGSPGGGRYASIDLDCGGTSVHTNNVAIAVQAVNGWRLPTDRGNLAGWKFLNCAGAGNQWLANTPGNPDGNMVYANLPNGTTVAQPGPLMGQEYLITDASSGSFASSVTGGGANSVKVRWNGSSWLVSG